MTKICASTKIKEGRGIGDGKDYKPFIKTREFNSAGTCSNFIDWKTGRQMQFLSQTELFIYMQLRWQDDVDDIKEQYPLNINELNELIAVANNRFIEADKPPMIIQRYDKQHWLTSDLVVYRQGRISEVVSVKYDKNALSPKEIETVWIEKQYWANHGCPLRLMDRSDVNPILVKNLRLVTEYYDYNRVYDDESLLKHKIATKQIVVNLNDEILDLRNYILEENNK